MDKEDGRKLSRKAQHERRKQAVRLHRRGMAVNEIATTLGMAQGAVLRLVQQELGIELPIRTMEAVTFALRKAAMKVVVFQCPWGARKRNADHGANDHGCESCYLLPTFRQETPVCQYPGQAARVANYHALAARLRVLARWRAGFFLKLKPHLSS
ncbi:MAG: hypothetical protein FWG81_07220 [Betaproteobacteria bacterium]|nr:hypothetical protein [Betaproteobacteria bacterium]